MSIKEKLKQIKRRLFIYPEAPVPSRRGETILLVVCIALAGTGGYGLGRLSCIESERKPVSIEQIDIFNRLGAAALPATRNTSPDDQGIPDVSSTTASGQVVGSRNSDKYHYPWCSGAQRISEANKVYFNSIEEARAAGYVPAGNCPGLK